MARAAAARDPLAREIEENRKDGFSPRLSLSSTLKGGRRLEIRVFRHESGEFDRLRAWELRRGTPRLVYLELSSSQPIEFDKVHADGTLPDLYRDGSRTLAYHVAPGSPRHALRLVRFTGGKARPEPARLGDASLEDVDGDGALEVVARSSPLGKRVTVECGDFWSTSQNARRTAIYRFERGSLAPASTTYAAWYDADIARLEDALRALDPRSSKRYGEFLGAALSLYYDYAEKGDARQGWTRFADWFKADPSDSREIRGCIERIRGDLRARLAIPADW